MTINNTMPKNILLASDMSARSDRALERATLLATEWNSKLAIACAIEKPHTEDALAPSWRRGENAMIILERKIREDLQANHLQDAPLYLREGRPEDVVLETAIQEKSDFIVTGVARYEIFGRVSVGETTNALVRKAKAPVLVVKKRAHQKYRQILVATDFSEPSKEALKLAVRLFPAENITVFHGYTAPYADRVDDAENYIQNIRKIEVEEFTTFLTETIGADIAAKLNIVVEHGAVSELTAQYVIDKNIDLVVIGTHGRSGLSGILLGSVAESIIGVVPADILVAR